MMELPWQNGLPPPLTVMLGVGGRVPNETVVEATEGEQAIAGVTVTEYRPELETVMLWVVAPVLHK